MKPIKLGLFLLVLLFSVSVSSTADAALTYSDGTETAVLTSISPETATLQYCGIEDSFSVFPEETNAFLFTYQAGSGDKISVSSDGQQLLLGAFQFNKVLTLYLVSNDSAYPGGGSNYPNTERKTVCYTCHGVGYCIVCHGTGRYSNYGQPSVTCSACGGDGKCWHCHGTGIQ